MGQAEPVEAAEVLVEGPERVEFRAPRLSRRQAGRLIALGLVLVVLLTWVTSQDDEGFDWSQLCSTLLLLGLIAWSSQHSTDRPGSSLAFDRDGVHGADGLRLHSWSGVVAVWVGHPRLDRLARRLPRFWSPQLRLYSESGLDFDRRAGTPVHPRVQVAVPAGTTAEQVAEAVSRMSSAPVLVGGRRSLLALEEQLALRGPA